MIRILFLVFSLLSLNSWASCPDLYPNKTPINIRGTIELCNSFYVSLYDQSNKAVVLVSEHLVKGSPIGGSERLNAFKPDPRVGRFGATNSDYNNSGYDRGHMAPAGDSASDTQMKESFLLTNMTPQEPTLNRQAWKSLEESIRRDFASSRNDFYILTIALYSHPSKVIGDNIPVPIGYWKIIYGGRVNKFYFAENKPNAQLQSYYNIDVSKILGNLQ